MRFIFIFFSLLIHPLTWAQEGDELLKKVRTRLDQVSDYQARGEMKIDVSFIKAPPSTVKIYYKKPSRFKVEKEGGISILPKGGVSINLNDLATEGEYTVIPSGEIMLEGKKHHILKLLPENETNDVVLTTLYIDPVSYLIRRSKVTTRENGTYEMDMFYGKYKNWGLPDKVIFSFNTRDYKLPKGVTFEYDDGRSRKATNDLKDKKGKVEITYSNYIINKGVSESVFK